MRQPLNLDPPVRHALQEDGDIVVRLGQEIAAGAGAEQDDALDPLAVEKVEGRAEASQQRVGEAGRRDQARRRVRYGVQYSCECRIMQPIATPGSGSV